MFQIEKSIPIPTEKSKYPFDKMSVGDSFYVEGDNKAIVAVRASANAYAKKNTTDFSKPAFVTKADKNGVRIWRTA